MQTPELYFTKEQFARAVQNLSAEERADFLERGQAHLQKPLLTREEADSVYTQHGRYYEIGFLLEEAAELLPVCDAIGNDPVYFERAMTLMNTYADFKVWTGPANGDRRTPWHSELATTRILQAFCRLYDAFGERMTPARRQVIEDAMLEKGIDPLYADWIDPERRVHALDSMGHNWWSVCISFCGIGMITLAHRLPDFDRRMALVLDALQQFCEYSGHPLLNKVPNFDDKGMFYESVGYFSYGVGELANFLFVYTRRFGRAVLKRFPVMEQVGDAIWAMAYRTSDPAQPVRVVNFGDSSTGGETLIGIFRWLLLLQLGQENQRYCYQACVKTKGILDHIYADLLWQGPAAPETVPGPVRQEFPQTGYCFWRSSTQPDATLLAMRCGYSWNHAHEDAGSFVLWANGQALLIDSGSTNYGDKEYLTYFVKGKAHNMVTVNGQGGHPENTYRGTKFRGTMPCSFAHRGMAWQLCDAAGPMAHLVTRNNRSFLQLAEDLFVIVDDLRGVDPATYQWHLHYEGKMTRTQDGWRLNREGTRLQVTGDYPAGAWKKKAAAKGGAYSTGAAVEKGKATYLVYETKTPQKEAVFMTVLGLDRAAEHTVTATEGDGYRLLTVTGKEARYKVYYNRMADGRKMHENSNNRLGDYDTDAYLLVEREQNGTTTLMMLYGSYLRKGERVLIAEFTKNSFGLTL